MASYGSDYTARNQQSGDVVADGGATLLSPFSEGETAIMAGPALLREIQAGVANGSWEVSPQDPTANISAENNLPYWTFTDVNSSGAITAAIVADSGAGSGNLLRFTIASGTTTGKSATVTRFVPVPSSASRSFSFYAEASFDSATSTTQATALLSCQYYKQDQTTTTGTAFDSGSYTFAQLAGSGFGITAPNLWGVAPDLTLSTAPANAAYLRITITIATVATQSAIRTIDLNEVRLAHGVPELILTDKEFPGTNPPAFLNAASNELNIQSGSGDYLLLRPDALLIAATTIGIQAGSGAATLQGGTTVELVAPSGVNVTTNGSTAGAATAGTLRATSTTEVTRTSTAHGFQIGANNAANLRMDTNEIMAVNNGAAAALFLQDEGGDVYIGDAATAAGDLIMGTSATSTTGAIIFKNGTGGSIRPFSATSGNTSMGVYNSSGSAYTALVASGFYPNQGSSFFSHNGTVLTANDSFTVTGAITATGQVNAGTTLTGGALTCDAITGTTATTNAAIWVLLSGTNYALRRNTSSARYKTNIVDADEAVLEAARKIRPRHYESTIEDEAGTTRLGFIAEEVLEAGLSHAVGYDAEGRVETLDTTALIAALFVRINDLEQRLADLESR